jgi:predicted  nucleic acid-binding Zn-ribbon protein
MKDWKDLFEKSDSLNLEEFMEKLDKSLPGEEAARPQASFSPPVLDPEILEQEQQWRQNLDELNVKWNLSQYNLKSTRSGPMGWLLSSYKKLLELIARPFSNVIIYRQAHLNANITNAFNILERRLQKIEQRFQDINQSVSTIEDDLSKSSRQSEDRMTHIRAALTKSLEDQADQLRDDMDSNRREAFSRLDELNQKWENRLEKLESRVSGVEEFPGRLEELRKEIYDQLPEVVEEVARRLEQTEASLRAIRMEMMKNLRDEVARLENQIEDVMVAESLSWTDEPLGGLTETETGPVETT